MSRSRPSICHAIRPRAVTSVPDEARGERLVVLHVPFDGGRDPHYLCRELSGRGLPNLWVPA
ncbi:MAG TPA: hypothetical protein VNK04_06850, partial [Gemmataceae bacterium]|nr:hypothetical protein [Gemmataceae bacterium]